MDLTLIWDNFLNNIKNEIPEMSFRTWFSETKLLEINDQVAKIVVPLHIHKKQFETLYKEIIHKNFTEITGFELNLEYILEEELKDQKINQVIEEESPKKKIVNNLNPKFTFENFIIGTSNKFSHAASYAVAENPGQIYNPLFIYGNSGLGKTHLMQAIGNFIVQNTQKKVLYVTSEQFISDFTGISRKNTTKSNFNLIDEFKDKYRNIDVLIIDDIQFLGGALQTQQEFFHTFNTLYDEEKQIIISSDRSVDDLKLLEDRLKTRFISGLSVNIAPPDFELRMSIIQNKLASHTLARPFEEEIIEYIANSCQSDVRQLEGAVTRIYAYSTMYNTPKITLETAKDALKDFVTKGVYIKSKVGQIQHIVAKEYNITIEDIKSKRRMKSIAFPRQIAMYLCRELTNESYPKLGTEFGGKDHATIIHAVDKIKKEMEKDDNVAIVINKLINTIKSSCE